VGGRLLFFLTGEMYGLLKLHNYAICEAVILLSNLETSEQTINPPPTGFAGSNPTPATVQIAYRDCPRVPQLGCHSN